MGPVSKEEALFYLHMVNSHYSPKCVTKKFKIKGYRRFLSDYESDAYKSFIGVYLFFSDRLADRDKEILDLYYGNKGKRMTLIKIGEYLGISSSRVQQLKNQAEYRIAKEVWFFINGWQRCNKKRFYTIIVGQSDEKLIEIGKATRPWEALIINYYNKDQSRYYKKRKKLMDLINRIWSLDMLDHRQQTLKILNLEKDEVHLD